MSTAEQWIDKKRVADSFSRAAATYDGVAGLQRDVGYRLLEKLPDLKPEVVMDLGSGTGYFTPRLKQQFSEATLLSLDLAEGMLNFSRETRPVPDTHWICADAESLPLADDSVDLIFSSLAIQWCESPGVLFSEISRILRPGGCFLFSTLGPETLYELRNAWAQVDNLVHVNRFMHSKNLQQDMPVGLTAEHFETELKICRYNKLRELTRELKELGAHNMNAGQPSGLTGRARVRAFNTAYESMRHTEGYLPATYQVYYGLIRKA
ncbi:MAG: malonyl-ACP O-methyltransferase BioC [Pontibacterium sp.]